MQLRLVDRRDDLDALEPAWAALLASDSQAPLGLDVTSSHPWACALVDAFLTEGQWFVVVAEDEHGVAGLLPVYWSRADNPGAAEGAVGMITDLNGGRNGFLVRDRANETLSAMLDYLQAEVAGWTSFVMRVVTGSASQRMLESLHADDDGRLARLADGGYDTATSPYLVLPENMDAHLRALNPKFRQEVQRRERRLRDLGDIRMRVYDAPHDVDELWEAMRVIEQASWKEEEGSSITAKRRQERFYEEVLPRAARAGQLACAVLSLDGRPIAYSLALLSHGVASGLKTSYDAQLSSHAPATVLAGLFLPALQQRGVTVFDFMGACEAHKMRWTNTTYHRSAYTLFNEGLGGTVAKVRQRVGMFLKKSIVRT